MEQTTNQKPETRSGTLPSKSLAVIQEMVSGCMQCGTCSASCPNSFAMDISPRRMWRMLLFNMTDELFRCKTFWLCSSCYTCTVRCPRGLPLTNAMSALKRLASGLDLPEMKKKSAFYRVFVDNIHTHGRIQEMDMMFHYFLAMKNPLLPLKYTPLGMKLFLKGKLHPGMPGRKKQGKLHPMFEKVQTMEDKS